MKLFGIDIDNVRDISEVNERTLIHLKKMIDRELRLESRMLGKLRRKIKCIEDVGLLEKEEIKALERKIEKKIRHFDFIWKTVHLYHQDPVPIFNSRSEKQAMKRCKFETIVFLVDEHEKTSKEAPKSFLERFSFLPDEERNVFGGEFFTDCNVFYGRSYCSTLEERVDKRIGRVIAKFRAYFMLRYEFFNNNGNGEGKFEF